mgnify:CR=1 FL=1|jgi:hypothetical protein
MIRISSFLRSNHHHELMNVQTNKPFKLSEDDISEIAQRVGDAIEAHMLSYTNQMLQFILFWISSFLIIRFIARLIRYRCTERRGELIVAREIRFSNNMGPNARENLEDKDYPTEIPTEIPMRV